MDEVGDRHRACIDGLGFGIVAFVYKGGSMPAGIVTDAVFQKDVIENKLPVLVDFHAVWCGPCKLAEPILNKLADEMKGTIEIVKLDVDENPNTSQQFGVMSIPTVILFKNGKELQRKVGFGGEAGYRALLAQAQA